MDILISLVSFTYLFYYYLLHSTQGGPAQYKPRTRTVFFFFSAGQVGMSEIWRQKIRSMGLSYGEEAMILYY